MALFRLDLFDFALSARYRVGRKHGLREEIRRETMTNAAMRGRGRGVLKIADLSYQEHGLLSKKQTVQGSKKSSKKVEVASIVALWMRLPGNRFVCDVCVVLQRKVRDHCSLLASGLG